MALPKYYYAGDFTPFEALFRASGREKTFQSGEYLLSPGKGEESCYYIETGLCVLQGSRGDGRDSLMLGLGLGSLYPFVCGDYGFGGEGWLACRAVTETRALVLTREELGRMVEENGRLALAAIRHHCELEHLLTMQRILHSGTSSRFRVGSFLYLTQLDSGRPLPLAQEDIANFVDLSRMQVSRVFRELRQLGLIQTGRHQIRVADPERLRQWCMVQMEI